MFYSQFILAKKGPLATIWIAAHLERKLRKNQITDTNIGESVDSILYPEVPIALRLSGHLLLGVVRIYSRKVNLLFNDCSDALLKIHQAFESSAVNLPPGAIVAPFNSITLPESFDFNDLEAHLSRENLAAQIGNRNEFEHHVTARDLITLQDQNDERQLLFTLDERFEDAGNPYAELDLSMEEPAPTLQKPTSPSTGSRADNTSLEDDVLPPLPMEDDMDFEGMNMDKSPKNAIDDEQQIDTTVEKPSPFPTATFEVPEIEKVRAVNEAAQPEPMMGFEEPSMDVDDKLPSKKKGVTAESTHVLEETPLLREEPTPFGPQRSSPPRSPMAFVEEHDILGSILGKRTPKLGVMPTPVSNKRSAKKRKQAFDAVVSLPSVEMKKQLKSTNDICRARQKAPSTEYEIWMSNRDNHMDQKFIEPSFPGLSYNLKSLYDGVLSKKFVSSRKRLLVEQASARKTPRRGERLDADGKEGVDDLRTIVDPEPPAEEEPNEIIDAVEHDDMRTIVDPEQAAEEEPNGIVAAAEPFVGDDINTKANDVDVTTEQLSPVHETSSNPVLTMDDGGTVNVVREEDEGISNVEQLEETIARDIRENDNEAIVNENSTPGPKAQGLAFLADSKDPDELGNKTATRTRSGKSSSSENGWSSRSRAVALYLKEKFEALNSAEVPDQNQDQSLNLENLLLGRTRKEAARLFFETLVLGTKGYLQVEQVSSYADIQLLASQRLLKAVF